MVGYACMRHQRLHPRVIPVFIQAQTATAFVCLLCEMVVQGHLAVRSEGGVEHTQKVARARGEDSLVELHADPTAPVDSLISSLGARGSATEMCSGCSAISPWFAPPIAAAATNNVITIDSLVSVGRGAPTRRGMTSDAN